MKTYYPILLLATLILPLSGCATEEERRDYNAVLYPSKQVLHDFFTAVDLDEKTGEWIGVKTEFRPPEDRQIALVVKLDQERVDTGAEVFYELISPGNFIVEVERKTYTKDVPTGVFFSIDELVRHGRVENKLGYGKWRGNFYVDGNILGQVEFEIINPNPEEEEAESLVEDPLSNEATSNDEFIPVGEIPALESTSLTPVTPEP